jgi:dimethylamine monooxygenase subunit A
VSTAWFDELDLDPGSTWRRMGTRALGRRPWLLPDDRRESELAARADLLDAHRDAVFAPAPDEVGAEVVHLVEATGISCPGEWSALERAGRSVQEDLCLLQRRDGAWHLDAAVLCFPSRWRLADKLHRPLVEVHGPTPGYEEHLAPRVDRLLDRLGDRPVLRRNWFVHPDPALHQPAAPADEPIVPAASVATDLHLRSERQTLRRLDCGWVLFTIRIQHEALGGLLADERHRQRFRAYVAAAPLDDLGHRGMARPQVRELCLALGIRGREPESDTTSDS